ncbi:MAG: hypothetical protein NXI28_03975 [bacterium]|nr:hypothetical protein [bacterium]
MILPDGNRKELNASNPSSTIPDGFGSDDEPIDETTFEDETERELRELESSLDL